MHVSARPEQRNSEGIQLLNPTRSAISKSWVGQQKITKPSSFTLKGFVPFAPEAGLEPATL